MPTPTTTYSFSKPTVGGDDNAWGTELNNNLDKLDDLLDGTLSIAPNLVGWQVGGVAVTSTAAELNILDGVTASTAEINILDGVTANTAELNILDGVTASTAELNLLDGVTATTAELNILDGVTSTTAELNILDGVTWGLTAYNTLTATAAELNILDGVTASTAELNILDGVTASTAEINLLDGVTASTAELNILDGVTSTAAELNILDGVTASTAELNILDGVTSTTAELNILDGVTATASEINLLDGKTLSGSDTEIITGTAGSDGDIVQWNADGDLVSYGAATQLQAAWEAGTGTDESLVSPANVKAAIDALRPGPYTTSIATTTGTTRDLTGIPAGVTEVDVFFKGVSHNNSDVDGDFLVQLGTTSGFVTSGYYSHSSTYAVSRTTTAGFLVLNPGALNTFQGVMRLRRIADGTQSWIAVGEGVFGAAGGVIDTWGKVITLASDLTQIRLTTVGGTPVFDAGNLSIRCRT